MTKFTQRQLRELVNSGAAVDVTNGDNDTREKIEAVEGSYTQIGYSAGVYGCNGMLLQGKRTKQLYAVTKRTTAIFIF